jgi:hypothetical protein
MFGVLGNAVCVCDYWYISNSTQSNILSVMVAETVSLGVLSLPAAVAGLGLVPYVHRMI